MAASSSTSALPAPIRTADVPRMQSISEPLSPLSPSCTTPSAAPRNEPNSVQPLPSPPTSPGSPSSPNERSFFDALSQRIRNRSRSRSRSELFSNQSRSPLPPTSLNAPTTASPAAQATKLRNPPTSARSVSFPDGAKSKRVSLSTGATSASSRSNSGSFTPYGRHSNEWLFNNFSFVQTVRGIIGDRRSSS